MYETDSFLTPSPHCSIPAFTGPPSCLITAMYDSSTEIGNIFRRRVDYCQRLASLKANMRGLGAGWRAIVLARLGPIFVSERLSDHDSKVVRHFVLDFLDVTKGRLDAISQDANNFHGDTSVSAVLVRLFPAVGLACHSETDLFGFHRPPGIPAPYRACW